MEERIIALIRLALKYHATDIHLNKRYEETDIEMYIDGSWHKVKTKAEDYKLFRYLKYMALMDVDSVPFTPRTSEFEMEIDGRIVQLRYSVIDGNERTDSVLRILHA